MITGKIVLGKGGGEIKTKQQPLILVALPVHLVCKYRPDPQVYEL